MPTGVYQRRNLKPHGTLAAYRRHERAGEKPCDACREFYNRQRRENSPVRLAEQALQELHASMGEGYVRRTYG
jgi:hypothetical protein